MPNRPKDVEGHCNAWLTISDDFGDNEATCRCQLPEGHLGRHREEWIRGEGNPVEVTWELDQRPELEAEEARFRGYDDGHSKEGPEEPGEDYLEGFCAGVEEREDFEREDRELRESVAQ
jgi:hypothetical protein